MKGDCIGLTESEHFRVCIYCNILQSIVPPSSDI